MLRRLTPLLPDQHWASITIDFVLRVLGVFLGIQVANRNGARIEDTKARACLARVHGNQRLRDVMSSHDRENGSDNVIGNDKPILRDMLAREALEAAR